MPMACSTAIPRAMHEPDGALTSRRYDGIQHADHGSESNPAAQQHDGCGVSRLDRDKTCHEVP